MEKKYSIILFVSALLCVVSLTVAYRVEYQYDKKLAQAEEEAEKREQSEKQKPVISTQGDAQKADTFYLMELNGYVVVYQSDKKTVFEYTDISVDELPGELQGELSEGKMIESTEKLYGFLENYSS